MRAAALALILLCCCSGQVRAQKTELVEPRDTISDYAEVVDPKVQEKLKELAAQLHQVTSVRLKVVVLRTVEMVDIDTYAQQLYERWDVGQAKEGLQHGVLLLVSILDRKVKLVVGKQVESVLPAATREQLEWNVLAALSRGSFSEGVDLGATAVAQIILTNWPKEGPRGLKVDWVKASLPLFLLFVLSVALTMVAGGGFIMAFSTLVGGLFGYVFLGNLGMVMGGALGFFLNTGRNEKMTKKEIEAGKAAAEAITLPAKKNEKTA